MLKNCQGDAKGSEGEDGVRVRVIKRYYSMFWLKSKFIGLVKLWFLLGIFILPFVFWPWAAVPYEIPKVWFFQRWVEGLGVLGVMGVLGGERGKEGNKGKKGEMFLVLGVLGFVLVAVISSLLGVDLRKSLVEIIIGKMDF